jgi:hypothetical protein
VFQDDVLVSGLKMISTQPVAVDYAEVRLAARREATKSRLGYVKFWLRKPTAAACQSTYSVAEFQECAFEHEQRHGELLGWG